jgi:hypothetical protein
MDHSRRGGLARNFASTEEQKVPQGWLHYGLPPDGIGHCT